MGKVDRQVAEAGAVTSEDSRKVNLADGSQTRVSVPLHMRTLAEAMETTRVVLCA